MIFNCFPLPKERLGCKQNSKEINFVVVENHEFRDQDKSKILGVFWSFRTNDIPMPGTKRLIF